MTAKKHVIQRMRKETTELNKLIDNQKKAISQLEYRLKLLKYNNFVEMENFAGMVDRIKLIFEQEIAWQALSKNPNYQLDNLTNIVRIIRNSVDRNNEHYMENNLDNPKVEYFYKQKLARTSKWKKYIKVC